VNVQEGEYLLAVNGRELRATDNVYSFFEATSGKQVSLRVGPNVGGADARDVTVVPVASEARPMRAAVRRRRSVRERAFGLSPTSCQVRRSARTAISAITSSSRTTSCSAIA